MSTALTPGEMYLYVAEIIGRGVKVGVSASPDRRIAQHRRDASAFGCELGRVWVSPAPQGNARENERALKGGHRREYLPCSFDDCVQRAARLPVTRLDPVEVADRSERTVDLLKAFVLGGVR